MVDLHIEVPKRPPWTEFFDSKNTFFYTATFWEHKMNSKNCELFSPFDKKLRKKINFETVLRAWFQRPWYTQQYSLQFHLSKMRVLFVQVRWAYLQLLTFFYQKTPSKEWPLGSENGSSTFFFQTPKKCNSSSIKRPFCVHSEWHIIFFN